MECIRYNCHIKPKGEIINDDIYHFLKDLGNSYLLFKEFFPSGADKKGHLTSLTFVCERQSQKVSYHTVTVYANKKGLFDDIDLLLEAPIKYGWKYCGKIPSHILPNGRVNSFELVFAM